MSRIGITLVFSIIISSMVFSGCYAKNDTNVIEDLKSYGVEYESIFKKDNVIDIKIELDESDWEDMIENAQDEKYKSADITVDGVKVENVGFRTKGNLTLRSVTQTDSDRYSFRVKFDKYVNGQNLLGLDEFVLNNMYSDPTYMREYLTYEALRSIGADVPETVFANIYVNGELKGLYLCVEALDDSFVQKVFGNTDGNLYKGEQGSNLKYVENSNYDTLELKIGDDTDKTGLKNMIKSLNEGNIEDVLDVDSALKYIAANYVLGNYDSYQGNRSNNFYLYENTDGIFYVIPWDFNMSFGGFAGGGRGGNVEDIDLPINDGNIESYPLVEKLLNVDEYKEKYYIYVNDLLDYLDNFEDRVNELSQIIRKYVEADPTKFYTMEEFENAIIYSETEVLESSTNDNISLENIEQMTPPDMQQNGEQMTPLDMQQNGEQMTPPDMHQNGDKQNGQRGFGNKKDGENMHSNTSSIINYVLKRVENIRIQLDEKISLL